MVTIDKSSYFYDKSVIHNGKLLEILSKEFRNFQDFINRYKTTEHSSWPGIDPN